MLQRRLCMEHTLFRSVEDCHDIHFDGARLHVEEPASGLSVRGRHSGGGMHDAWGYVCPAAGRFVHDCNICRTNATADTSPMQYLPPHTRVVGYGSIVKET